MVVHHESQRYRDALSAVLAADVFCRWRDGAHRAGRAIPARLAAGGPVLLQSDDHHARFGDDLRRRYASLHRACQLADPDDDPWSGHGVAANEQLVFLVAAVRVHDAAGDAIHAWRRPGGRLDHVSTLDAAAWHVVSVRDLLRSPDGHILHHGRDQRDRDGSEHAGARHVADAHADVRLDMADYRLSVDRNDAGAGGRDHHAADRPIFRHHILQCSRRWRSASVSAYLLVLRAPGSLHHDSAGLRHRIGDYSDLLA